MLTSVLALPLAHASPPQEIVASVWVHPVDGENDHSEKELEFIDDPSLKFVAAGSHRRDGRYLVLAYGQDPATHGVVYAMGLYSRTGQCRNDCCRSSCAIECTCRASALAAA